MFQSKVKSISTLALILMTAAVAVVATARPPEAPATRPTRQGEKIVTPSGLTITMTHMSEGARVGDTALILYTGMFTDGTVFDASKDHNNEPIPVKLGAGQVIKGWEEGLIGMQVGEKRHLVIPPALAYGEKGRGDKIPPNSTLEFDVELVALSRQP